MLLHAPPDLSFSLYIKVLPLYEYIITLEDEYNAVWRKKKSATSVLLLSIRWIMVVAGMLSFVQSTAQVSNPRVSTREALDYLIRHRSSCSLILCTCGDLRFSLAANRLLS